MAALCGLQAQSPASPYIALWNRIAGFDPAELDRAIADHRIVKATLMRLTLHAVTADDYPAFYRAMVDDMRRSRVFDSRFTDGGVAVAEAEALLPSSRRTQRSAAATPNSRRSSPNADCPAATSGSRCADTDRSGMRRRAARGRSTIGRPSSARGRRPRGDARRRWRSCCAVTWRPSARPPAADFNQFTSCTSRRSRPRWRCWPTSW